MAVEPLKIDVSFSMIPSLAREIANELRKTGLFDSVKVVDPQPSYNRATVLQELWEPTSTKIYCIDRENNIGNQYKVTPPVSAETLEYIQGLVFAPTKELAEEIVSIRKGEWLPKKGDKFVWCTKSLFFNERFICEGGAVTDFRNKSDYHFPSPQQRDAFIEKNKPKEKETLTCRICSTRWSDINRNCPNCEVYRRIAGACNNEKLGFKIGDTVILKPNSILQPRPIMVIRFFTGGIVGGINNCKCRWFDESKTLCEAEFSLAELLKV